MKLTLAIAFLFFLLCLARGQMVVGDVKTVPSLVSVSTGNVTMNWVTSELSSTSINCTGPGIEPFQAQVETEPVADHLFFLETNFTGEGVLACTLVAFPLNGTAVTKNFNISVFCEGVRLELPEKSVNAAVYFTRPKGSGPYEINASIKVKNACIGRANVSVTVTPPSGIGMRAGQFSVFGLDTVNALITFSVPDYASEGMYFGGLAFFASGSSASGSVNFSVHWPGPKLAVSSEAIGNVKSGTNSTKMIKLKEGLGYRAVEGAGCSLIFEDPAQAPQSAYIGRIEPFGEASCPVYLSLPERDVVIGNYSVFVLLNSSNAGTQSLALNYTIPAPYMLFAPKNIDLGKLTFESGKDVKSSVLSVIENGGFTPIEDMRFTLLEGENGWLSMPSCDYVPPGGRVNCTFRVALNENASIGPKEWTVGVKSRYLPEATLKATVEVYFIGIDDALAELEATSNYSVMSRFGQAETLKTSTTAMLNGIRGGNTGIPDTAAVIAMHGGVTDLLGQMEGAQAYFYSGEYLETGRNLLGGQMALEQISSSYRLSKVKDAKLLSDMGLVYAASADFWTVSSKGMTEKLEEEASASEGTNYQMAAEYYSLLDRLYAQNNSEKSAFFARKTLQMEKNYEESVSRAGDIKQNADKVVKLARENTILIGTSRLILNPLSYGETVGSYRLALADYEAASKLYDIAGQKNELNSVLQAMKTVEGEYGFADRVFSVGSVAASMILILIAMRAVVGMQRYREDEEDVENGGVMVQ